MSSELVKKLQAEWDKWDADVEDERHTNWQSEYRTGFLDGLNHAINIAEKHEAEQIKEPFYQLDQKQTNLLAGMKTAFNDGEDLETLFEMVFEEYEDKLSTLKLNQVFNAFTTWAIEQEKMEEEK
ncbi:hypothetical protein DXQ21_00190 [Listeria monocytogenes]|nr:hypothetical protein [Listeria monocytogenes]